MASLDMAQGLTAISDLTVQGKMNTPIDFIYPANVDVQQFSFSMAPDSQVLSVQTSNSGSLETKELASLKMRYTPRFGFRGLETQTVYLRDVYGNQLSAKLTIIVGNNINILQPALAVRASGCITCHTNISSNFITDFGLGGDGKGRDYFFGNNSPLPWNSGSIYGDHGINLTATTPNPGAISTMNFLNSTSKLFTPISAIPEGPMLMTGKTTLASYLRDRLVNSVNPGSKNIEVVEKKTLYIGAPSSRKILDAFQMKDTDPNLKFIPEKTTTPALAGLTIAGGILRNTGVVTCEGDLAFHGIVHFEKLQLQSRTGCRIYATDSVFIYGPIEYLEKTDNTNLQITSSRAIVMGAGSVFKDGVICEKSGDWYYNMYNNPDYANTKENYNSSLKHRFKTLWTIPSHFLRENKLPTDLAAAVYKDSMTAENVTGPLLDASCRSETRDVSFERLLLNAPQVQSRYRGDFKGVIISEFALMSLGRFVFAFDPVFIKNTALPMLDEGDFLSAE